uniref:Uncharacterized protein n=1 Tax=Naja naja TaxID=35670 RepID=A0A8C6XQU8_NAJNA
MCVGTCTRILGPCLLILGFLSITANILLLFPNWEWCYLSLGQISKRAMLMPGVWGGGLLVSRLLFNNTGHLSDNHLHGNCFIICKEEKFINLL